uniref:uncharacterized protein LOC122582284 n=1 Tax=Erigeron canadensis TaxID=72917 RepID=UPI001CB9334B|nr:uncharacterized protein LOC122582284 [Erigeron canadensis]
MVVVVTSSLPLLPILKPHHANIKLYPFHQSSFLTILSPPLKVHAPPRAIINHAIKDDIFMLSEANPPEISDQIVSADNGDGVSIVISVLLSVAFVGLSVLTIGVIYIAVTDYLQKREKEKFEKEEAEKAKKGGKKKRVRARAGPKGFGQKIDNDDDD